MKVKFLVFLFFLGLNMEAVGQTKPALSAKIDQLSNKLMQSIHSEDIFIRTGKSIISAEDQKEIRKIVMSNGFPTISMVGKESSHKFWMLVQLSDSDIPLQMAVLKQMKRANRKNNVIKEDFAMLTDRVRINKGAPQLYGTQYRINNFGDISLYEVMDQDNVNERRKNLNMSKISESEAKIKEVLAKSNIGNSDPEEQSMSDNY